MIGSVLRTEWFLETTVKSSTRQARTALKPTSFRTIGATTVPRISMASNIFWCGSVETAIWNVTSAVDRLESKKLALRTAHPGTSARIVQLTEPAA